MAYLNDCKFIGRLGRDPDVKYINNKKLATFSIAVSKKYKSNGEQREQTSWVDVEIWGNLCDVVQQYVKKGSEVLVSGEFRMDSWADKDTGEMKSRPKFSVFSLQLLGGNKQDSGQSQQGPAPANNDFSPPPIDDLPF